MDEIIELIKTDFGKSLFTMIVTAAVTHFLTKKSEDDKKTKQIMEVELNKIYLPLFVFVQKMDFSVKDAESLLKNMKDKKKKYLIYISDTYLNYIKKLEYELEKDGEVNYRTIIRCKKYIEWEYLRLKRKLKYPYKQDFTNKYFLFYLSKAILADVHVSIAILFLIYIMFWNDLYETNYEPIVTYITFFVIMLEVIFFCIYLFFKIMLYDDIHYANRCSLPKFFWDYHIALLNETRKNG